MGELGWEERERERETEGEANQPGECVPVGEEVWLAWPSPSAWVGVGPDEKGDNVRASPS